MKTYNQFITELNRFEAAMRAGKLSAKALKRVFADPKTGAFKINTTKITNPLANAMFKKQGLKKRVKPINNTISKPKAINNSIKIKLDH